MRLVSFCLAIEHAYAFFDAKKRFLEIFFGRQQPEIQKKIIMFFMG